MLDAVSTGLHPAAVVGQLAGKYGVSVKRRELKAYSFSASNENAG